MFSLKMMIMCKGPPRLRRTATFILYLTEGFEGGETVFDKASVSITPKVGQALLPLAEQALLGFC